MSRRTLIQFPLQGGLDLETPTMEKPAGALISCKNYEAASRGGYDRIEGFERFDGRPSPTDAAYYTLNFDAGDIEPSVGDSILGGTSAATAEILAVVVASGSWADNDAVGYLAVTKLTGTWQDNENIRDAGDSQTHAVMNGTAALKDAEFALHKTYLKAAREEYRADISTVPGSDDMRGVWLYNGNVYAFRDNAGATECQMYKSSVTGWSLVDLGAYISFNNGSAAFIEDETVTGATSSAIGDVVAFQVDSGTWAGGDAAGALWLKNVTGTFQAENITSTSGNALCTGAQSANTLSAGGQYEFINYNFQGQAQSAKMYGCNGVNKAFSWDGSGFAWIVSGAATDTPTHITAHQKHLFLAVDGSILHSSIGNPLEWSAVTGAAEIATGDTVVGFVNLPDEALGVFCRNITYVLYGTSALDWQLETLSSETGAIEWSIQNMGTQPKYLDDRGIVTLRSIQEYGNFSAAVISDKIEPYIQIKKDSLNASMRVREKDQYRLFFSEKTGVYMRSIPNEQGIPVENFTIVEFPVEVKCTCSSEDSSGDERLFFGSDDGYVYELDKGDSFDGANIEHALKLAFVDFGSPEYIKRVFKLVLDVNIIESPTLNVTPDFSYGNPDTPVAETVTDNSLIEAGGDYDAFNNWGTFAWDSNYQNQAEVNIDGSGTSLSVLITGEDNYGSPHRIHGIYLHYSVRGLKR